MERPEAAFAYLEHCSRAFLDAIAETREFALAGDSRFAETLHFASDLLDVIADGLGDPATDPAAMDALAVLRGMLSALRADLTPRGPLH